MNKIHLNQSKLAQSIKASKQGFLYAHVRLHYRNSDRPNARYHFLESFVPIGDWDELGSGIDIISFEKIFSERGSYIRRKLTPLSYCHDEPQIIFN